QRECGPRGVHALRAEVGVDDDLPRQSTDLADDGQHGAAHVANYAKGGLTAEQAVHRTVPPDPDHHEGGVQLAGAPQHPTYWITKLHLQLPAVLAVMDLGEPC